MQVSEGETDGDDFVGDRRVGASPCASRRVRVSGKLVERTAQPRRAKEGTDTPMRVAAACVIGKLDLFKHAPFTMDGRTPETTGTGARRGAGVAGYFALEFGHGVARW